MTQNLTKHYPDSWNTESLCACVKACRGEIELEPPVEWLESCDALGALWLERREPPLWPYSAPTCSRVWHFKSIFFCPSNVHPRWEKLTCFDGCFLINPCRSCLGDSASVFLLSTQPPLFFLFLCLESLVVSGNLSYLVQHSLLKW